MQAGEQVVRGFQQAALQRRGLLMEEEVFMRTLIKGPHQSVGRLAFAPDDLGRTQHVVRQAGHCLARVVELVTRGERVGTRLRNSESPLRKADLVDLLFESSER